MGRGQAEGNEREEEPAGSERECPGGRAQRSRSYVSHDHGELMHVDSFSPASTHRAAVH